MVREGDTREEILRVASRLIQTRGYNGFSYAHVAEALGVKTAAIHYHFKSKTDLGVAVAQRFRDQWQRFRERYESASSRARVQAVFEMYARLADRNLTCPLATIHAELDGVPEPVAAAAAEVVGEMVDWLEDSLERARADGTLTFAGDARELALVTLATAQGALQLARTRGSEVFHATRSRFILDLLGPPKEDETPSSGA